MLANVFVLRSHVNGNITAGVYLVDLRCLGIKDTFFRLKKAATCSPWCRTSFSGLPIP